LIALILFGVITPIIFYIYNIITFTTYQIRIAKNPAC
jgi:hypothetical protein